MQQADPITIPPRAAAYISKLITVQQMAEQELRSAVQLLAAALDAPDGWQVHVQPDGGMAFAPLATGSGDEAREE